MKKFALIFDFDGTIADTLSAIKDIFDKLSPEFGFRKIGEEDLQKLRAMDSREIMKELGIPWWKIPRLARRGKAELAARIDSLKPIVGIQAALKRLKEDGHALFIVSSNSAGNIEYFLARNGLSGLFDFIGSDSSLWGKARVLKKLVKKEKLTPDGVIYVGDETRDIEAAKKAGVRTIAVAWGFNAEAALRKRNPDHLAKKPEDLFEIVGKL